MGKTEATDNFAKQMSESADRTFYDGGTFYVSCVNKTCFIGGDGIGFLVYLTF